MTEPEAKETYGRFFIEKATGTHADVFAAVGLADLLAAQSGIGSANVRLRGSEADFVVEVEPALDETTLANLVVGAGYRYLRPKSRDTIPPGVNDVITYEVDRDRAKRYAEARKALREAKGKKLALDPALEQTLREEAPPPDWRLMQVMYALTNHVGPNQVHAILVAQPVEERQKAVGKALRALARGESPTVGWKSAAVQLFNPIAAKGYARLKPDSTDRNDKTKEQWTNPFVEWLRYRGYFRVACPFFQGPKGEHIRVYTPIPANTSLDVLATAAAGLRGAPIWGGPPKADALAILWLADLLIRSSRQGQELRQEQSSDVFGFDLSNQTPADVIAGLAITNYQSLGSARAVSSITTLAMPGWFPVTSAADVGDWLDILDEHRRVVLGLDDSHSDEIGLLLGYRRFLERRGRAAFEALLAFLGDYGPFVLRAWQANHRVRAFRTTNFRRLLEGMASDFSSIVVDPGFEAIARAVRRATVQAQFLKSRDVKDIREIRYDLLPELRRARAVTDPRAFVEVVSDFVTKYNAENARRREINKRAPANVQTVQFASFLRLIDAHGANVVGALLCAYGTCVEPHEPVGDDTGAAGIPETETDASITDGLADDKTGEGE